MTWKNTPVTLTLALLAVLTLGAAQQAAAQATSVRFSQPFSAYLSCANGGAGEFVSGEVTVHDLASFTVNAAGGLQLTFLTTLRGTAVGEVSGDVYTVNERFFDRVGLAANGQSEVVTLGDRLRLVGRGTAPTATLALLYQRVVNANGDVVVNNLTLAASCG